MNLDKEIIVNDASSHGLKVAVVGVGGAGCNAINNIISSGLSGVTFIAANTDLQSLEISQSPIKIQLGPKVSNGFGSGSNAHLGKLAAEESLDEVREVIKDAHMIFFTCGMGGGTGTGATPVLANLASELGILSVAFVTTPFLFEGSGRMNVANSGIKELKNKVDTLVTINNQNLFKIANDSTTLLEAFKMADDVINGGVRGIVDLILHAGLVNLDFADITSVIRGMGLAIMGIGVASGEGKAINASNEAVNNPLIDSGSITGATSVLLNISGSSALSLFDVESAAKRISELTKCDNMVFGTSIDESLGDALSITIFATGLSEGSEEFDSFGKSMFDQSDKSTHNDSINQVHYNEQDSDDILKDTGFLNKLNKTDSIDVFDEYQQPNEKQPVSNESDNVEIEYDNNNSTANDIINDLSESKFVKDNNISQENQGENSINQNPSDTIIDNGLYNQSNKNVNIEERLNSSDKTSSKKMPSFLR